MIKRIRLTADRKEGKSRISNGAALLPSQDGRSAWARIMRDCLQALIAHCGGIDEVSDPKRMACRRIAAIEAELIYHEDRIASVRRKGKEPPASLLQMYSMLADRQRRLCEVIGYDLAKPIKDITLEDHIANRLKANGQGNGHARSRAS
jgi:hypothetical protein